MSDERIQHIRNEIDRIDADALRLLSKRAELVISLGRIKQAMGLKLFDPDREEEIFKKILGLNEGPFPSDAVSRIFERIIDESRRLERTHVYDKQDDR